VLGVQIYVDKLVKVAYENWENVVEYDGEALIGVGGRANGTAAEARGPSPLMHLRKTQGCWWGGSRH